MHEHVPVKDEPLSKRALLCASILLLIASKVRLWSVPDSPENTYVCMYVCMYMHVFVSMYVYVYVYV